MYFLNKYGGYIWDFSYYLVEAYRREQIQEMWQIYIAKCVSAGISKDILPDYAVLLQQAKGGGEIKKESPEEVIKRLQEKINRANGGEKNEPDEFVGETDT